MFRLIAACVLALYASAHVAFAILRPADAWVYLTIASVAVVMFLATVFCGGLAIVLTSLTSRRGGTMADNGIPTVNMPYDRVQQAYRSYVDIMDMIADQGDNVSETMVIEAIDDIVSAWLDARETREMIRHIVTGARTGDIGPDAEREVQKTRDYLAAQ